MQKVVPSFSSFINKKDRGQEFKELIQDWGWRDGSLGKVLTTHIWEQSLDPQAIDTQSWERSRDMWSLWAHWPASLARTVV